jgi:hypothetical protein
VGAGSPAGVGEDCGGAGRVGVGTGSPAGVGGGCSDAGGVAVGGGLDSVPRAAGAAAQHAASAITAAHQRHVRFGVPHLPAV